MTKDKLQKISYFLSQGGSIAISEGLFSLKLSDTGTTTTIPTIMYYDFLEGLDEVFPQIDYLVDSYKKDLFVEDKTVKILKDNNFESNDGSYQKFYDVISYLIKYNISLGDNKQ